MDFRGIYTLAIALLVLGGCRSGSENLRGKAQSGLAGDEGEPSADGTGQTAEQSPSPVIEGGTNQEPLRLKAEVDQSGLPAGFIDDIFAVHKIDGEKTILFGKSKQAFLLDEKQDGVLTKLSVDISAPPESALYILENKNFWIVSKTSVSFPSTLPSKDPAQLTLINLAPEIQKDAATNPVRVLFAGPQRLIMANDKRANIVLLEGDKARVIALDFPKSGEAILPVFAAGLLQSGDSFWFLSSDRLLLLKKNGEGTWRWVTSKFKVDAGGLPPEAMNQVAMVIDAKDDKTFSYVGRTFELAGGKIYEQNPIKLRVDDKPDLSKDPAFINDVQPLLKSSCTPCHPGYEEFATVKSKAAAFKQMIGDGTMPKGTTLTPDQIKLLTDYMTKILAP